MGGMRSRFELPAATFAVCALSMSGALSSPAHGEECRYDVVLTDAIATELDVTVECDDGLPGRLVMTEGAVAWAGSIILPDGTNVAPDGTGWDVPAQGRDGAARYRMALRDMAAITGKYLGSVRTTDAVLAMLDAWLARPEPPESVMLSIRFRTPSGGDVATAMTRAGDAYRIAATDVSDTGQSAFGTFERISIPVPSPGALAAGSDQTTAIDLVIVGPPMAVDPDVMATWVGDTAQVVAEFWRGFPVARPLLILAPDRGRKVTFGRVTVGGGRTITVLVGRDTTAAGLYDDWVLVHEFLHLGSPYMRDTGAWLNEGIATLYEPIVRYRAGWKTREEVWREWISDMPKGLYALGPVGLQDAGRGGVYWGGALLLLLADIELRQRTDLIVGVEDCLRAVRDGGNIDNSWTTNRFLDECDAATGGTTLSDLAARHLGPADPPDLDALWAQLGVSLDPDGTVRFDDDAPLADVREAILDGGPNAAWQPVPVTDQ